MLVAVVVLSVLAAVLAVLLLVERRRRSADAAAHEDEVVRLAADLEVATADARELEERAGELADELDATSARLTATDDRLASTEAARVEALARLDDMSRRTEERAREIEMLTSEHAAVLADREALSAEVLTLRERLLSLESASREELDAHRPGIEADALWALELARAERTWRHSVAAGADEPSPFEATEDPLAAAVEIEVSALREDVGVAMELDWDAPVADPARCLTVLRLAQELLAVAAREQQAVILRGRTEPNGEVALHLSVPDGHPPLRVTPPPLGDRLISVHTGDGLRLVVH